LGLLLKKPGFRGLQETLSLSGRSTRRQHVGVSCLGLCGSGAVGNLGVALAAAVTTPSAQVSASCRAPSARRQSAGGTEGRGRLIALDLIDVFVRLRAGPWMAQIGFETALGSSRGRPPPTAPAVRPVPNSRSQSAANALVLDCEQAFDHPAMKAGATVQVDHAGRRTSPSSHRGGAVRAGIVGRHRPYWHRPDRRAAGRRGRAQAGAAPGRDPPADSRAGDSLEAR
jgi:hypothetical protein